MNNAYRYLKFDRIAMQAAENTARESHNAGKHGPYCDYMEKFISQELYLQIHNLWTTYGGQNSSFTCYSTVL